jgi:hypothetical protein
MVLAAQLWRDYVTDGVPASGVNQPIKSDARTWGTGLENGIAGVHAADIPSATTTDLSGAAGELVDVTGTTTITAITLADGNVCTVRFTGALTLTNGASLVLPGGANILTVAGDFAIFRGYSGGVVRCAAYQRNNGTALVSPSVGSLVGAGDIINASIVESHTANAVTFSLKTLAGADPSSSDPVKAYFRSATPGSGAYVERVITSALSITLSSGSTAGVTGTGVAFKLWKVLFDDAGTVRMGVINTVLGTSIYPLAQFPIAGSTAEGGAGAADNAQVFYTGTAVSAKAYIPLGYSSYESGLATAAGTWDASPTRIQIYGPGVPLPGTVIQTVAPQFGTLTTVSSTTTLAATNITASIKLSSAANLVRYFANSTASNSSGGTNNVNVQMYRNSTAIGALMRAGTGTGSLPFGWSVGGVDSPGSVGPITYVIKFTPTSATTGTVPSLNTDSATEILDELMT